MDSCKGQRAVSLDTELDAGEVFFCSKGYRDGLFTGNNLCFSQKGVIWLYVKQDVIDRYSLTPDMVSCALETMRDVEGHPIFVLFADLNGRIRVEFRSDRIRIVEAAVKFGGGGHECACGARLDSPDQIPLVVAELEKYL